MWFWGFNFLVLMALAVVVFGGGVMWLWNSLMPELFGLSTITWVQAIGLLVLSRILFGSWGRGHRGGGNWRHKQWRTSWKDRWEQMSPEEREQMKQRWGRYAGGQWGRNACREDGVEEAQEVKPEEEKS